MCPLIPCQVNKSGGPPVGDLLAHPGVGVLGKTRFAQASLIDSGTAGIGNSTLTVHWAHEHADRLLDGHPPDRSAVLATIVDPRRDISVTTA